VDVWIYGFVRIGSTGFQDVDVGDFQDLDKWLDLDSTGFLRIWIDVGSGFLWIS
jgi:hypothetical protein